MTNLFENTDTQAPIDEGKDYIQELVGEGKKFKTVQDLARGKYEADNMIEIFKRQQDQLRADYINLQEEYNARAKLEELVDQHNQSRQQPISSTIPQANDGKPQPIEPIIEGVVTKRLNELKASELRERNAKMVEDKLKEHYGNNFSNILLEKTKFLGLTRDQINNVAETSPQLLIQALGLNEAPKTDPFQTPPRSTSFQPTAGGKKRTWSYYQELKKTDPQAYRDPKTTVQMEKDYAALGADFEDGDFNRFGDSAFA